MGQTVVDVTELPRSFGRLRSPGHAMLWELWRVTRVELAWRLAVGIIGSLAVLVAFAAIALKGGHVSEATKVGAIFALGLIVMPQFVGWISLQKLTIGRPGFPFSLLYRRPVSTAAIVGIPMAYLSAMPAALYLMSALLLRATSGYAFPLVSVAAWIAALNLVQAAINWSTRNWIITFLGNIIASGAWFALAARRISVEEIPGIDLAPPDRWPTTFDFPLTDYAVIAAMGLAAFGLAVAGVARQRHGDAPAMPWTMGAGFPPWLVNLFRFRCPTSSPTRAQVWFDLKSSGLPVLTIGLVLALVNPLVFALSVRIASVRLAAIMCGMFSTLAVLLLGGNAFGLRLRSGSVRASAFEATQPARTARLAGLKVLVRSVCMLAAFVAVGGSMWASLSFIAVGKGYEPLRSWQHALEGLVGALTGLQQVTLAFVASVAVAVMVASLASFSALAARDHRRPVVRLARWLLLLHGLVLFTLVMTGYRGVGSVALWDFLLNTLLWVTRWIDAPVIVLATVYVCWRVLAERLLTLRSACGAAVISAAFGAAWLTLLRAAGVSLVDMSATNAFWLWSPALLPMMATVLAPWSLSRVRHT